MGQSIIARRPIAGQFERDFVEGRQGFLIPDVKTKELGPGEFLQFFRDTIRKNIWIQKGRETDFYYSQAFPSTSRFVLPSSEQNPLVLIQYSQSGHQGMFAEDKATHEVLVEPDEPGDFQTFLKIHHPINLERLTIKTAEEELNFDSRGGKSATFPRKWFHEEEETEPTKNDRLTLGRIAASFVDLVS